MNIHSFVSLSCSLLEHSYCSNFCLSFIFEATQCSVNLCNKLTRFDPFGRNMFSNTLTQFCIVIITVLPNSKQLPPCHCFTAVVVAENLLRGYPLTLLRMQCVLVITAPPRTSLPFPSQTTFTQIPMRKGLALASIWILIHVRLIRIQY
jgi:hypothetical protein